MAAGRVYAKKNDTMYSIYYGDNIASLKNTQNAYKQLEAQSMGSVSVIVFDRENRRVEKRDSKRHNRLYFYGRCKSVHFGISNLRNT